MFLYNEIKIQIRLVFKTNRLKKVKACQLELKKPLTYTIPKLFPKIIIGYQLSHVFPPDLTYS